VTSEGRYSGSVRRILPEKEAAPLRRMFKITERERRFLEQEWDTLLEKHRGQWVAVNGRELLFADSIDELIEAARSKGWPLGTMIVDQLIDRRPAVLL